MQKRVSRTDYELCEIADGIEAIAARLRCRSSRVPSRGVSIVSLDRIQRYASELSAAAMREHELRRMREAYIGIDHFGEPVWDMLTYIFAQSILDKTVAVTAACSASHSPPTTALRYIGILVDEGVLTRSDDPADQRRTLIRLSGASLVSMGSYFLALTDIS